MGVLEDWRRAGGDNLMFIWVFVLSQKKLEIIKVCKEKQTNPHDNYLLLSDV